MNEDEKLLVRLYDLVGSLVNLTRVLSGSEDVYSTCMCSNQ